MKERGRHWRREKTFTENILAFVLMFNIFALFLIPLVLSLPSLPPHSFEKRVLMSKKNVHDENVGDHTITVKKVFIFKDKDFL